MIEIKQLLKAYETIQQAKIEQELSEENKKIQEKINEHYTCYNRCFYLKYEPEEKKLIEEAVRYRTLHLEDQIKHKKQLEKILKKIENNKIYWKLENKI